DEVGLAGQPAGGFGADGGAVVQGDGDAGAGQQVEQVLKVDGDDDQRPGALAGGGVDGGAAPGELDERVGQALADGGILSVDGRVGAAFGVPLLFDEQPQGVHDRGVLELGQA